jgi:hypothetical protein
MLQWYGWMSRKNSVVLQVLQGFHQCQRGRLLAYLQTEGRVCLFVIDGKISTTRVYLFSNDSKIKSAVMMAWKEQKCKLRRRSKMIVGSPIPNSRWSSDLNSDRRSVQKRRTNLRCWI